MSISVTAAGTIQVTDPNTGTLTLSKLIAQSFTGTVCSQGESVSFGTAVAAVTLPISPAQIVYVANLSLTNTATVTWTPNGGASAVVQTLQPALVSGTTGGMILLCNSNTTSGITALSISASGTGTLIDYFLAG